MLTRIDIDNFRCIESACLEFDSRATGIIGANASGKTSLLEAIYFLSHGRSFRTQSREALLGRITDHFRIVARLRSENQQMLPAALRLVGAEGTGWASPPGDENGSAHRGPGSDMDADCTRAAAEAAVRQDSEGRCSSPLMWRDTAGPGDYQVFAGGGRPGAVLAEGHASPVTFPGVPGLCSYAVSGRELIAGIEYSRRATTAHLEGRRVRGISEIAGVLPIQVIDPGVHRLIEEGSFRRRRLMDWGVFHVKHEFLTFWRRYQRALSQRNSTLKTCASATMLEAWDRELASAGATVDVLRNAYAERLAPYFERLGSSLIGSEVCFSYRRGWPGDLDLAEALQGSRVRDLRLKATQIGPHRADLEFLVDGKPARERISRGQQKMLAAAFILSQLAMRAADKAPRACLMLDDPAAELDVDNLKKLFTAIADIPAQLIVTSVHRHGLQGLEIERLFHVEQGRFSTMI